MPTKKKNKLSATVTPGQKKRVPPTKKKDAVKKQPRSENHAVELKIKVEMNYKTKNKQQAIEFAWGEVQARLGEAIDCRLVKSTATKKSMV